MDIDKAVDQISEIHRHLAKSEIFYGYKPGVLLTVGIIAFITAALQTWLFVPASNFIFLIQWLVIGVIILVIISGNILYNYLRRGSNFEIHQMAKVFVQFIPSIIAGVIMSLVLLFLEKSAIEFLPGLWAIIFGLGIFSMRPYLPRMIGFVALFYLLTGGILLCLVHYSLSLLPWGMGLTFGTGHLLAALILKLNIIRAA